MVGDVRPPSVHVRDSGEAVLKKRLSALQATLESTNEYVNWISC